MAKLPQLARPVVCRGAGLHADQARRQTFKKPQHLAAAQSLPRHHLFGRVDPVNLENVLRDSSATITLWHFDAGSGRRPPHQKQIHAAQQDCMISLTTDQGETFQI
jgi:hypothetical protein